MKLSLFFTPGLAISLACGALAQSTGTLFCSPTNNSTGTATILTGSFGSGVGSDLHLHVSSGVPGEFGYFLAGNEATPGVVISNGVNCLVGTGTAQMFRYNLAGGPSNSLGLFDGLGVMQNLVGTSQTGTGFDVPDTVPGNMPINVVGGDTWHFQYWHRDTPASAGTSNFSNGLSVTFGLPQPIAGMVSIPAGTFDMGSDASGGSPYFGDHVHRPVHNVSLSRDFWMGEHEVTQSEFEALMGTNPSNFIGPNLPVDWIKWVDAKAYCEALTAQEKALGNVPVGFEYRLPTEAEWEYACRAGTTTEFNLGLELLCGDATVGFSRHTDSSCNTTTTEPVGSHAANAFGLFDMHGNVSEWCLDTHTAYTVDPAVDPFFTGGFLNAFRIVRGGAWNSHSENCRSASRSNAVMFTPRENTGFRVVLGTILVP